MAGLPVLTIPGSYVDNIPQQPPGLPSFAPSVVGVVGCASYGKPNTPLALSKPFLVGAVGGNTSLPFSIADAILNGIAPEGNNFQVVRVTDGSDVAASVAIVDGTGFAIGNFTASGTPALGNTIQASIVNGATTVVPPAYVLTALDTKASALAALANIINSSAAVIGPNAFLKPCTSDNTHLYFTALASGTGGNAITIQSIVTGGGIVLTDNTPTALTGGAAPGSYGTLSADSTGSYANNTLAKPSGATITARNTGTSPTYRLSLLFPDQNVEVFDNLPGYASLGGGFSATALMTSIYNAVNTGSSAHAPSANWMYTRPGSPSSAAPLLATFQPASGGTDGAAGVTTNMLLGTDGETARTGIYALRGLLSTGTLVIAGLLDMNAGQAIATFCQQENCLASIALGPAGTTPTAAAQTIQNYSLFNGYLIGSLGEPQVLDALSGTVQYENPAHGVAGLVSVQPPWDSPLNKPQPNGKGGIIATEWSVGQFPDETQLQSNYICYWKKVNGIWVLWNDFTLNGSPIADMRMMLWIGANAKVIGNKYIGKLQSTLPNDPVRGKYIKELKGFLAPLLNPTDPKISAAGVSDGLNTPTSIAQGYLVAQIQVQTARAIRYVLAIIQVGSQLQVSISNVSGSNPT